MAPVEADHGWVQVQDLLEAYKPARMRWQHERRHGVANSRCCRAHITRVKASKQLIAGLGEWKIQFAKCVRIGGQPLVERCFHRANVFKDVSECCGPTQFMDPPE
jgi:hypothetical protein